MDKSDNTRNNSTLIVFLCVCVCVCACAQITDLKHTSIGALLSHGRRESSVIKNLVFPQKGKFPCDILVQFLCQQAHSLTWLLPKSLKKLKKRVDPQLKNIQQQLSMFPCCEHRNPNRGRGVTWQPQGIFSELKGIMEGNCWEIRNRMFGSV